MLLKYLTQVGLLGSKCLIRSHQLRILGAHAHVNGLFKIQPQNFSTTSQIQMSKDDKQEPKKKGNKLLWIGAFTIGFGFYLLSDFDEFVEDVKPPKINVYGIDIFPLVKKIFKIMPDGTRKNFTIKMGAPNPDSPLLDPYICNGKNPYHVEEVLENKVWRVTYDIEQFGMTHTEDRKNWEIMGDRPDSEEFRNKVLTSAQRYGDDAVTVSKNDIEKMKSWFSRESFPKEELFSIIEPWFLNMMVVKLNSGGLLLYAPVKVHKDAEHLLIKFLESLGPVKYLVAASSAHTLCLPDVIKAFPDAKVAGPKQAEEKIKYINVVEKFDYVTDDKDSLQQLNNALANEGVELFELEGDLPCNAVLGVVDKKLLLECDVCYGHHDGIGLFDLDAKKIKKWKPEDTMMRNFKFTMIDKPTSKYGFLPNYRFWLMDPNSMGVLMYEQPAKDGSDRDKMAASIRNVLAQQYDSVVGVHFNKMTREDFNKSVDACWNWLDGKPLN